MTQTIEVPVHNPSNDVLYYSGMSTSTIRIRLYASRNGDPRGEIRVYQLNPRNPSCEIPQHPEELLAYESIKLKNNARWNVPGQYWQLSEKDHNKLVKVANSLEEKLDRPLPF